MEATVWPDVAGLVAVATQQRKIAWVLATPPEVGEVVEFAATEQPLSAVLAEVAGSPQDVCESL
jgi:hypothetical protein